MAIPRGSQVSQGVILRQALQRAGNERLLLSTGSSYLGADPAPARVKLNRILEDLYRDWDWPFLWTEAPVQFGASFPLPEDFDRAEDDWALSWGEQGSRCWAAQVDRAAFEVRSRNLEAAPGGGPLIWSVDYATGVARVWPTPDHTIVATLRYKFQPVLADPQIDPVGFDETIPLFPWADYLMDAVFAWAQEYEQDPRYVQTMQINDEKLKRIRATAIPARSRQSVVPLDPQVFTPGPYRGTW